MLYVHIVYILVYNQPMVNSSIHVRLPLDLKNQFEDTLAKMGLNMSEAIKLFASRVIADQAIPFTIKVPNASLAKSLRESENGIGLVGPFNNMPDLIAALHSDDDDDMS